MCPMLYRWARIYPPPWDYPSDFTWGMRPLSEFPKMVGFLLEQGLLVVPDNLATESVQQGRELAQRFLWFAGLGALIALFRWYREPWRLFALFVSLAPFLIGFRGALIMLEEHPRFYIQTLPGVILLWAIAWQGFVALGACFSLRAWRKTQRWFRFPLQTAIVLGLLLGGIPTVLSPVADWRREWSGTDDDFREFLSRYENKSMHQNFSQRFCRHSLDVTVQSGRPLRVTIYEQSFVSLLKRQWEQR